MPDTSLPEQPRISLWDVCACDHYRGEHDIETSQCETVVIAAGRERNCACRAFRFMRERRR